jgi:uncharacterized membrane protein
MAAVLRAGTFASAGLMALGLVLDLASIAWTGLLLLTLTPAAQLAVALVAFGRRRETRYAVIAGLVLLMLLAVLAIAAGVAGVFGD